MRISLAQLDSQLGDIDAKIAAATDGTVVAGQPVESAASFRLHCDAAE